MIITVLGWGTAIILSLFIILIIESSIHRYKAKRRTELYYKNLEDFGSRISDCRYWLNTKERQPFQKMFDFIVKGIKSGNLRGDSLREKVDEIINEHNLKTK